MALLYDRILRHRKIIVNKSDTVWNWAFNMPCKSLKGILVLFEEEQSYTQDTSKFYNPKIQEVSYKSHIKRLQDSYKFPVKRLQDSYKSPIKRLQDSYKFPINFL